MADVRRVLISSTILLSGLAAGGFVFRDFLMPAGSPPPVDGARDKVSVNTDRAAGTMGATQGEQAFVSRLARRRQQPVAIDRADDFVAADQPVSLPQRVPAPTIAPQVQSPQARFDAHVAAAAAVQAGELAPSAGVAAQPAKTAPRRTGEDGVLVDQSAPIHRSPRPADVVSIGELLEQHGKQVDADDVYYVHTVQELDTQGIWGIIQDAVVRTFARGVAVDAGGSAQVVKLRIPDDADERLADDTSSFLGKLIYRKTMRSHVYNFTRNRMGSNPDVLRPRQEIVIVSFRPGELISIYRYFRNQG